MGVKTPEEIKKGLEVCRADECHGHHTGCPYDDDFFCIMHICGDALALIEHLEAKVPKWISVEERLPEYKTAVLGYGLRYRNYLDTDPFPAVHVVYSRGEDEGWFTFWNNEYVAVTHWMPLPEPTKEESE